MSVLEEMKIEINMGDISLEEDGFSSVTDAFENPFEEVTESREQLPVQATGIEIEKAVEAVEKDDNQETGETEENRTEAPDMEQDLENKRRAEHEAAEAKRKAEWEARRQAEKDAKKAQMERIMAMSEEELMSESMKRVGTDTEKLTRRNMKECVAEYIQTLCLEDAVFARQVMLPQKNMIRCFQYINRKAYEYVQDEMKATGIQPGRGTPCYSSDIPDDFCYHWAEEYFRAEDVKEDKEDEEKFVPRPYVGRAVAGSKRKKAGTKKSSAKKTAEKKVEKKESADSGQLSFMEQLSFESVQTSEKKAG